LPSGPSASLIVRELRRQQATHVVGLPDNASKALFERLHEEPGIRVLTVTREGEAFAVASGLWAGGAAPVVLIQNTGLLESGDALRGTAMRMRIPLVCLVTYRGYAGLASGRGTGEIDGVLLSRPGLDSTAVLTEPTLRAWGVVFDFLHGDEDLPRLTAAFEQARSLEQPVAVLVTRDTC
jgi:thiamine pyrophosphate-dependent acetolactate synthase large subunit-like protein